MRAVTCALLAVGLYATTVTAADRVLIVNEGGIREQWTLADGVKLVAPGYPADFAPRGDNVCIAIGYAISPNGATSDYSLLKAWNSSAADKEPAPGFWNAFSQAGANALSEWKFKPRPEVDKPQTTYTVATMTFMGKEGMDPATLRQNCAISNLKQFVQQQKANRFMSGLNKHDLDTANRSVNDARASSAAASSAAAWSNRKR